MEVKGKRTSCFVWTRAQNDTFSFSSLFLYEPRELDCTTCEGAYYDALQGKGHGQMAIEKKVKDYSIQSY
jgi:hypothetical protein